MVHKNSECNARCWYAKSHPRFCKCECGGKNHGHGMKGEEMVRIEKVFPPCTPVRGTKGRCLFTARSKGETFLFKGEIRLVTEHNGVEYAMPLDEIEKADGITNEASSGV